jgi:hypothetical protein
MKLSIYEVKEKAPSPSIELTHHLDASKDVPTVMEMLGVSNRILFHPFKHMVTATLTCAQEGCLERFEVNIYPHQHSYPKYCRKHQPHFQRMEAPERWRITA